MHRQQVVCAVLALGALFLAACAPAPAPAPDTRAADEKAIRDLEAQWAANYKAKDAEKLVSSYYADDASILDQGRPIQTGKEAILKSYKEELDDPQATSEISDQKVEVAKGGDLAYLRGVYSETFTDPKTKRVMAEKGKYVAVFKKQADGSWKAIEDGGNPDAPATPVKP